MYPKNLTVKLDKTWQYRFSMIYSKSYNLANAGGVMTSEQCKEWLQQVAVVDSNKDPFTVQVEAIKRTLRNHPAEDQYFDCTNDDFQCSHEH